MGRIARCMLMVLALITLGLPSAQAFVSLSMRGDWPEDWPRELEPFRERSLTARPGMPLVEANIHQIPFKNREEFEKVWPSILRLKSTGAPITLVGIDSNKKRYGLDEWSNARPCVRVIAPPRGGEGLGKSFLKYGPPWPNHLRNERGELPELVHNEDSDGTRRWVAGKGEIASVRCRTELEIVVDGEIIDVDRLEIPEEVTIIDRRTIPDPAP